MDFFLKCLKKFCKSREFNKYLRNQTNQDNHFETLKLF